MNYLLKIILILSICLFQINSFSYADNLPAVNKSTKKMSVVEFSTTDNIFNIVDEWSQKNNFHLKNATDTEKTYQKGSGLLTPPIILKISQNDDLIHIESYVKIHFLARINSLFILPSQMSLSSGGFRAVIPRKLGRSKVNELLLLLQQEPIK